MREHVPRAQPVAATIDRRRNVAEALRNRRRRIASACELGPERGDGRLGRRRGLRRRRDIRRGALALRVRRGDHAHAADGRPIRLSGVHPARS